VGVKRRSRRDYEKLYFKPMNIQIEVIVFVKFQEFVAVLSATNSSN